MTVLKAMRDPARAITSAASLANRYVPPQTCTTVRSRDSQRSALYAWEVNLHEGRRLKLEEMQHLSNLICGHFGVSPVSVRTDFRLQGSSFFSVSAGIVIASAMNDEATLWHEVAHYLVWKMAIREPSHGPAFVATLIAIRVLFGRQPKSELLASAGSAGLEINTELLDGLIHWKAPVAA